jgi:hypothetical protein
MLFAREVLAPGPQSKHPGNVNPVLDTGPPAEPGVYQNENCFIIARGRDNHEGEGVRTTWLLRDLGGYRYRVMEKGSNFLRRQESTS